jgi:Protein of unknown function (DUF3618)
MDETANEIEAHIDRTRERLGSNLRELEDRVDAATDWREQFRERPLVFLGVAVVGGVVLGNVLGRPSPTRGRGDIDVRPAVGRNGFVQGQASELWSNVQAALVTLASARITEYIGELIPGFDEHYRRAERRAGAVDPTTTSLGGTTS